jgi:hypothetical protein
MPEQLSPDRVYVEFFVEYLSRIVPDKIELAAEFHEHARNWAERTIRTDDNPLDIARRQLVELWDLMRPFRDPPAERSDKLLAALLLSLVRSEPLHEPDLLEKEGDLPKDKVHKSGPRWSNIELSSVTPSKYEAALREIKTITLKRFPVYGDLIDLDKIQQDAAIMVAANWDERLPLRPYAIRVLKNTFWDALRNARGKRPEFIPVESDENPAAHHAQTGTKMREWEASRDRESSPIGWMIGRGQWKDAHALLAFWISQTKLDFVKVLAFIWCQWDRTKHWPYREEQFAIPLGKCVELLDVSPALKRLLSDKSAIPVSETELHPRGEWLRNQLYRHCIWNDFASQKVAEQFNDWIKVVPKNARSIVRATWNEMVEILRDSQEGAVSKLCYFLTVGIKRGIGKFVLGHLDSTIQDLAIELVIIFASRSGSRLHLARLRGNWEPNASYDIDDIVAEGDLIYVATDPSINKPPGSDSSSWKHIFVPTEYSWITKDLARERFNGQKVWHLRLSTTFHVGGGLTEEARRQKLEGEIKTRVNRIHRQVQVNILRKRGYALSDSMEAPNATSY